MGYILIHVFCQLNAFAIHFGVQMRVVTPDKEWTNL